ncbi:hypothetical protein B0O99DRAFT_488452, partial [Bisporella sp. PMI_857]
MFTQLIAGCSLLAAMTAAHFTVEYPEMRGDSFADGASQWIYPCANVNQTAETNRTDWPLTGGSVVLDLHHAWTYLFINLGIGTDYPSFSSISLTPDPLNITGNGTYCIPAVTLPTGLNITDGLNASIQVVTVGESGSALYNCADITFRTSATLLSNTTCVTSQGITNATLTEKTEGAGASLGESRSMMTAVFAGA